jgi:hypothetical protein
LATLSLRSSMAFRVFLPIFTLFSLFTLRESTCSLPQSHVLYPIFDQPPEVAKVLFDMGR